MKKLLTALLLAGNIGVGFASTTDALSNGFRNIPDSIKTGHFWYWMSDNISKEGVVADLKAMKQQGIGIAYIGFIGGSDHHKQNYPIGKVKFMSPEWWEVLHTALKTATDLGIDIGIFNSPGWSQSGGPWIPASKTMRYLVGSRTTVKGGKKISIVLPQPDSLFQDVRVLALPTKICAGKNAVIDTVLSVPKLDRAPVVALGQDSTLVVPTNDVVDISQYLDADGRLTWKAPKGNWTILRLGMAPTGAKNSPAVPESQGWEADKMSREIIQEHFRAFLGKIYDRIPAADRKCWKYTVLDSYEKGGENMTDGMIEKFKARYGYDPVPYLPAYYGYTVGSREMSDRFLWDMRRLFADEIAYQYVGGLRDISHQYGLQTWLENYGHGGFCAEFLQYGGQSDNISGEFWHGGHLAERRAASSCAHTYGKPIVWAEAFTNDGRNGLGTAYAQYPGMLKGFGDQAFASGINSMFFHVYIQQYDNNEYPGVDGWFGTEFNRKNTWYSKLGMFTKYIKRNSFMLQQGRNVADVAYFIGENAPIMTGRMDPQLPSGYQFDFINAEILLRDAKVKNGNLVLPNGQEYKVLVLPPYDSMRPNVLKKIAQLIADGATVVGKMKPTHSPSLENYPQCDEVVKTLANQLWDKNRQQGIAIPYGKGRLIPDASMEEAFKLIGTVPDCLMEGDPKLQFAHRTLKEGTDIYFITNQENSTVDVSTAFRVTGRKPESWDATDGTITTLPEYKDNGKTTNVKFRLLPYESTIVVFRKQQTPDAIGLSKNVPDLLVLETTAQPWKVTFQSDSIHRGPAQPLVLRNLEDFSLSDNPWLKYYSGNIDYQTIVKLKRQPRGRILLDLGNVGMMATVKVNGAEVGGVWTAPYVVDVTEQIKKGNNRIEVETVNTWLNRILGDQKLPANERMLRPVTRPWKEGIKLQPTGLLGPVRLLSVE